MGVQKKLHLILNNKKRYPRIKTYSFYRKDFWGLLRLKRLYKYKHAVYSIMKGKRRFYRILLSQVFKGIKFFVRRYDAKANLFMVKKRLKFFYYKLTDKQIGKLGTFFVGGSEDVIGRFFSVLECRLDLILVRSLYFILMTEAYVYISKKNVFVNSFLISKPEFLVKVGDIVSLFSYPQMMPFFLTKKTVTIDLQRQFLKGRKTFFRGLFFNLFFFYFCFFFLFKGGQRGTKKKIYL